MGLTGSISYQAALQKQKEACDAKKEKGPLNKADSEQCKSVDMQLLVNKNTQEGVIDKYFRLQ
jgi:hypothetical protein